MQTAERHSLRCRLRGLFTADRRGHRGKSAPFQDLELSGFLVTSVGKTSG